MMHLAVREDDLPRAESLVARVGKDFADSTMFAVAHGDSATVARLLAEAGSTAGFGQVVSAVWQVGEWLERPAVAEPFARTAAARPEGAVRGNAVLAENLIAQGRWTAADSALAAAERAATDPRARVMRGLMATLPFLAVPRARLEAIRADVAAWVPAKEPSPPGPANELLPQVQRYVLGLLASRLGEGEVALREAAQLETAEVSEGNRPVMRSLAAAVRADVALGSRRPADALKALEAVRGEVPLDLGGASPFGEDYARFLRGEALLGTGNDGEALRWLEHGFDGTPDEMAFRAQVSLRLGDIYERKGERQKAIDSYSQFVRLWSACDPRLQPAVEGARARLARLTGEPRS
jgi:tetratricopeptide (TPR) repeat protein